MSGSAEQELEKLRELWTPDREIEQLSLETEPQTLLDSMIRDLLHRVIQQRGSVTLILKSNGEEVPNTGTLRWKLGEIPGYEEITIWIE